MVVAILTLLAGVGIVQLLRARITTNEQLALNSLRLLAKSCQFYFLSNQQYPPALTDLGPAVSNPAYVNDTGLLSGAKQGYQFSYTPAQTTFTLLANPQTHGSTGVRHFFTDQTLTIHATEQNRNATAADPVLPQ